MAKRPKRKKLDLNELAKQVADNATGLADSGPEIPPEDPDKDPKAVSAGRLGGRKGGRARAKKLSSEQRSAIARKAALARWRKPSPR